MKYEETNRGHLTPPQKNNFFSEMTSLYIFQIENHYIDCFIKIRYVAYYQANKSGKNNLMSPLFLQFSPLRLIENNISLVTLVGKSSFVTTCLFS